MKIEVKRQQYRDNCTSGKLFIDGEFQCFTLEDVVRAVKIYGVTAIPAGTYQVVMSMSGRFKKILPELLNVPGFTGIRIHAGNTEHDTSGCLLLGKRRTRDTILESRVACGEVFPQIQAALDGGQKVFITIS